MNAFTKLILFAGAGLFLYNSRKNALLKAGIGAIHTQYFNINSSTSIDELKKQYYSLAKKLHPDKGGTNEAFREMNDEYEHLQRIIITNGNFSQSEQTNETEISEIYRDIINSLITIPDIIIEIVGSWIWISGNTYPVKEQIKEVGFKFHGKKAMWFWHPGDYRKFNNKEMDMEQIRKRYGSEKVTPKYTNNALSGIGSLPAKLARLQELLVKRENLNKNI